MEEEREKEKKGKLHRTVKAQCRGRGLYNNKKVWLNIHIYTTYTHKQNQNSTTKIKSNRLTWQTKGTKNDVYQNKTN